MIDQQPMSDEEYFEACARSIRAVHGPKADKFVAERVSVLARQLNHKPVETWEHIRRKLSEL